MTRVSVVEVVETRGLVLAVFQLLEGDVEIGTVLGDSTGRWRIEGISTASAAAWHEGRRGVKLQPLGQRSAPDIGAQLNEC
jgi:hypothetical protein